MVLGSSDVRFLCIDSEWWLVIATLALVAATAWLVIVTRGLWTTAQEQLRDQHWTTVVLRKALFVIGAPMLGPSKPDFSDYMLFFTVTNKGETAAWDVKVTVDAYVGGKHVEPQTELRIGHLAHDEGYGVLVHLDSQRALIEDYYLSLYFIARFVYDDIEKKNNGYSYRADYDYDRKTWQLKPGASVITDANSGNGSI
jgi:hypothetical protein